MSNPYLPTIFAAAREHGVTHEGLHDIIALELGKASLKDLTKEESLKLLDGIRGEENARPYRRDQSRRDAQASHGRRNHRVKTHRMINTRERQLLVDAATLRGWDGITLAQFAERQLGTDQIVTMADFNKVFWALKAMNRRDGLHK